MIILFQSTVSHVYYIYQNRYFLYELQQEILGFYCNIKEKSRKNRFYMKIKRKYLWYTKIWYKDIIHINSTESIANLFLGIWKGVLACFLGDILRAMVSINTFINIYPSYIVRSLTGNLLEKRGAATRVLRLDMELDVGLVPLLLLSLSVAAGTAAALWRNVKC